MALSEKLVVDLLEQSHYPPPRYHPSRRPRAGGGLLSDCFASKQPLQAAFDFRWHFFLRLQTTERLTGETKPAQVWYHKRRTNPNVYILRVPRSPSVLSSRNFCEPVRSMHISKSANCHRYCSFVWIQRSEVESRTHESSETHLTRLLISGDEEAHLSNSWFANHPFVGAETDP